jgi:hypothetical protein
MGCPKCKKNKNELNKSFEKKIDLVGKGIIIFTIIWSLLAICGLISLIKIFI